MPDGVGTTLARGAQLVLADRAAGDVGHGGDDPDGRHVQGGDVSGIRVDGVELGPWAATARGVATSDHEAGVDQPGQELAGRRLGESGELADLRPGEGPVLEEQVQGRTVVDAAQQARRTSVHSCLLSH